MIVPFNPLGMQARRRFRLPPIPSCMVSSQAHPLRRLLFQLHLWLGVSVGLVLLAIGVSGSALVFRPEIEEALYVPRVAVSDSALPVEIILSTVTARYPDRRVSRVQFSADRDRALEFVVSKLGARSLKEAQQVRVFTNPYTGEIVGSREQQASWVFVLQDFHFSLLGGVTGLKVNGVVGGVLVLMSLTGLVAWWPTRGRWRNSLRINTSASWKRITWDLHAVMGFVSSLVLMLFGLTGVFYGFRAPMTQVLLWSVNGAPPTPAPKSTRAASLATIDAVLRSASEAVPNARILALRTPASPTSPWVASASIRNHSGEGEDRIYVDAGTAEVLRIDRPSEMPRGARILEMVNPVHLGTFGGVVTRALWFLFGLVPLALFATAMVMWWNRVLAPRWRRRITA